MTYERMIQQLEEQADNLSDDERENMLSFISIVEQQLEEGYAKDIL